jgi:hypothetical protein
VTVNRINFLFCPNQQKKMSDEEAVATTEQETEQEPQEDLEVESEQAQSGESELGTQVLGEDIEPELKEQITNTVLAVYEANKDNLLVGHQQKSDITSSSLHIQTVQELIANLIPKNCNCSSSRLTRSCIIRELCHRRLEERCNKP